MTCDTPYRRAGLNGSARAPQRGALPPPGRGLGMGGPPMPKEPMSQNHVPQNHISEFLVWLRLWLGYMAGEVFTDIFPNFACPARKGYQRPPSLLPEEARAAIAPRILVNRRRRRIIARGLPPSRRYNGLHHLNDRRLTVGQFLERACRFSVNGRVGIYGLEYRLRLCQRKADFCAGPSRNTPLQNTGVSLGLSVFHLGPD